MGNNRIEEEKTCLDCKNYQEGSYEVINENDYYTCKIYGGSIFIKLMCSKFEEREK